MAQYGSGTGDAIDAGAVAPGTIVSDTIAPTLLSLTQFGQILGVPPVHLFQGVSLAYPDEGGCASVWFQYDWQASGKASREAVARAIANAEARIAQLIGFWPAPKWITEEIQPYPRQRLTVDNSGSRWFPAAVTGRHKTLNTKWKHFIAGGRRQVDLIALDVAIAYPVEKDDGFALLSTTWTDTQPEEYEVAVFAGTDTSPQLQIRGLRVQVTALGAITITGRPSQFFVPSLWESPEAIDADDIASYLSTVNVYRVYNSMATEDLASVEFGWQTTVDIGLVPASGVLQSWDDMAGRVSTLPAVWNTETSEWDARVFAPGAEPHTATLFYQAGWPLDAQGRVKAPFARAIAALAAALIGEPICGCAQAEKLSGWWQSRPDEREQVSYRQLECPFGMLRGSWEAYRLLSTFWGAAGSVAL